MHTLQKAIRTIKHFHRRQAPRKQKESGGYEMMKKRLVKVCVECGGYVPPYQKYLCEECWGKALNEKLDEVNSVEKNINSNKDERG